MPMRPVIRISKNVFGPVMAAMLLLSAHGAMAQQGTAAQDVARLYALPPEGSIYVRVLNPERKNIQVQVGDGRTEQLSASAKLASDYRVQPGGGDFRVRVDGKPLKVEGRAPGSGFVTLVLKPGAAASAYPIIDQAQGGGGLKAELALYNLVQGCSAKLSLAAGAVVLPSVAEATRAVRAINPVQAVLVGQCGASTSAPLELPALKAGDRYSLFLIGGADAPVLKGQAARTEAYRAR